MFLPFVKLKECHLNTIGGAFHTIYKELSTEQALTKWTSAGGWSLQHFDGQPATSQASFAGWDSLVGALLSLFDMHSQIGSKHLKSEHLITTSGIVPSSMFPPLLYNCTSGGRVGKEPVTRLSDTMNTNGEIAAPIFPDNALLLISTQAMVNERTALGIVPVRALSPKWMCQSHLPENNDNAMVPDNLLECKSRMNKSVMPRKPWWSKIIQSQ